jgi:hypothetical protein
MKFGFSMKTAAPFILSFIIIAITPLWRINSDDIKPVGTLQQVRETIDEVCALYEVCAIDGNLLIPHLERLFADDVHPNDEGFARMSLSLCQMLRLNK